MGAYQSWLAAERGPRIRRVRRAVAVVGRRARGVLAVDRGLLRGQLARAAVDRPRRRADAGRGLVPGRDPELRRARPADARPRPRRRRRHRSVADAAGLRAHRGAAARRGRALPRRPGTARRRPRRPGGRATSRTSPRRSWRCSRPPASARSGRRARRSSASAASIDRFGQIEPTVLLAVDGYRYGDRAVDRRGGARRDPRRAAVARGDGGAPLPRRRRRTPAIEARDALGRAARGPASPRVRARPVRPPALHPVLVGHDRAAQADRARPRRHPARAPEGARPAHRSRPGRPVLLVHHHRLDDVELPGFRAGGRLDRRDCRRQPGVSRTSASCGGSPPRRERPTSARARRTCMACRKAGLEPGRDADLPRCAASARPARRCRPRASDWVYDAVSPSRARSARSSGGTDVCTGFVGPSPLRAGVGRRDHLPDTSARRSRRTTRRAARWSTSEGELVITAPMPSMPVGFWNDPDGSRATARRTSRRIPGVWRHGDWITITDARLVHHHRPQRRDAQPRRRPHRHRRVLRRRRGAARDRRQPRRPPRGRRRRSRRAAAVRVPRAGGRPRRRRSAGGSARASATTCRPATCRTRRSPVPSIPRTLSGKKLEVPVKRILLGLPADVAASRDALADPRALEPFEALARERQTPRGSARRAS